MINAMQGLKWVCKSWLKPVMFANDNRSLSPFELVLRGGGGFSQCCGVYHYVCFHSVIMMFLCSGF